MTHSSLSLPCLALLLGCASTPARPLRSPTRPPAATVSAPVAPPPPITPIAPLEVRAPPSNPLEFTINASSDLPPLPASTAQPYERVVEAAVAPLRPALAECLRALGAPSRRVVRITIEEDGALRQRPPQDFALRPRDASCLDGVLRATTVEPAPPRPLPYDLRVNVAQ